MIFSVAQSMNCIDDNKWASLTTNVISYSYELIKIMHGYKKMFLNVIIMKLQNQNS